MADRWLPDVLDIIIEITPADFNLKSEFFKDIQKLKSSIDYTAPEAMKMRWYEASLLLDVYLGEPDADWKLKIANIFSGKDA